MNKLKEVYRKDLPGRFNEMEMLDSHFSCIINIFNGNILPPYISYIFGLNPQWYLYLLQFLYSCYIITMLEGHKMHLF